MLCISIHTYIHIDYFILVSFQKMFCELLLRSKSETGFLLTNVDRETKGSKKTTHLR